MPRRDAEGDAWRCTYPGCRLWTWTNTSTKHCFGCGCAAPPSTLTRQGRRIGDLPPGHRDLSGFVPPGAAAAADGAHVDPARAARPVPVGRSPRSGNRGAAGAAWRVPTPPPPPRGHSRGPARTGDGPATYARNSNRDVRGITADRAAGDYRDGRRRAIAKAPGGAARTSPGHVLPPGGSGGPGRGASPGRRGNPRDALAAAGFPTHPPDRDFISLRSANKTECWAVEDGKKVRWGMPACLEHPPLAVPVPPAPPTRERSVTEENWLEWHRQQSDALATAERRAAAAEETRGAAWDSSPAPSPRTSAVAADGPAGIGDPPLLLEGRFADRAALPKGARGVTFAPTEASAGGCGGGSPPGTAPPDADAEMGGDEPDAEESAGSQCGDEEGGDGGVHTPVWPPADASLAQLEEWLDALRRLPGDDVILNKQALLSRRVSDLRMPLPAPPAEPLIPSS